MHSNRTILPCLCMFAAVFVLLNSPAVKAQGEQQPPGFLSAFTPPMRLRVPAVDLSSVQSGLWLRCPVDGRHHGNGERSETGQSRYCDTGRSEPGPGFFPS